MTPRGTPRLAAAALVMALLATGCATGDVANAPALAPPTLPEELPRAGDRIELPSAPPPEVPSELASRLLDEAEGAAHAPGAQPGPGDRVAGYTGDRWAEQADGQVVVLSDTLAVHDGLAFGLVRNQREQAVGPVTVSAGDASTVVPLPVLRPGEPAPFVVALPAGVDAGSVAFTVEAPVATELPVRELGLVTYWQRGGSDPRPVDNYLFTPSDPGARPAAAFGAVEAAADVEGLVVVAAWIDPAGRVLAVDSSADLQRTALLAGESGDFLVARSGPDELSGARVVLWATGSSAGQP